MTKLFLIPVLAAATLGLSACGKTGTTNTTDTTVLNDESGLDNADTVDANAVGENLVVPEANGTDAVLTNADGNAL